MILPVTPRNIVAALVVAGLAVAAALSQLSGNIFILTLVHQDCHLCARSQQP